ncbi:MAG: hypothetical protein AAF267_08105, partial [Deinococcota bacterium]
VYLNKAFQFAKKRITILNQYWDCACYLAHLVHVAVFENRLEDAQKLRDQALRYASQVKTDILLNNHFSGLQAEMALAFGEFEEAQEYVSQALSFAQEQDRLPSILENLVTLADLLKHQGDITRAAEILGCVKDHPATGFPVKQKAETLWLELGQTVEPVSLESVLATLN